MCTFIYNLDPNTEIMKLNYYTDHPLEKKKKERKRIY